MAAAILLFCFQGAGRKLSTECRPVVGSRTSWRPYCRPSAEKVRRPGAKGTKEQGLAGVCAPSRRRPSAEKARRLGAKGTKEQGFAGICAPSPCRPSAEKARRLGAKGTKEQGLAGVCAPSSRRPSAEKARRLGAKGTKEQGAAGICAPSRHWPSVNPGPKNRKGRPGHRPSWRPIAGKTLYLRCEAPTFCPGAQPSTGRVGAPLPAKPCASVARRQHFALERSRSPAELAPHYRQSLVPPLRGANILPWSAAGHRPSWRPFAGKTLCLRYRTPTFCPGPAAGRQKTIKKRAPSVARPWGAIRGSNPGHPD